MKYVIDINGNIVQADTPLFLKSEMRKQLEGLGLTEQNIQAVQESVTAYMQTADNHHFCMDVVRAKGGRIKSMSFNQGKRKNNAVTPSVTFQCAIPVVHGFDRDTMYLTMWVSVRPDKAKYAGPMLAKHSVRVESDKTLKMKDAFTLAVAKLQDTPGLLCVQLMETSEGVQSLTFTKN